jgi:SAM-dependent methyltransferase
MGRHDRHGDNRPVLESEWANAEHVERYLSRLGEDSGGEGDVLLLELVPHRVERVLDLGTGDGRLLSLLQRDRPGMTAIGIDASPLMLEKARGRFAESQRTEIVEHDLRCRLPAMGVFDAVVSSLAIHHLEHERKRELYGEVFEMLEPGGIFVNYDHVASPTRKLHLAFFEAIDEPIENEDPSDRLLDVHTQLTWLQQIGFEDADCLWKWRELALLAAVKPAAGVC